MLNTLELIETELRMVNYCRWLKIRLISWVQNELAVVKVWSVKTTHLNNLWASIFLLFDYKIPYLILISRNFFLKFGWSKQEWPWELFQKFSHASQESESASPLSWVSLITCIRSIWYEFLKVKFGFI